MDAEDMDGVSGLILPIRCSTTQITALETMLGNGDMVPGLYLSLHSVSVFASLMKIHGFRWIWILLDLWALATVP